MAVDQEQMYTGHRCIGRRCTRAGNGSTLFQDRIFVLGVIVDGRAF